MRSDAPVAEGNAAFWSRVFWILVIIHAVGIGAWVGLNHPLDWLKDSPPKPLPLRWFSPADFLGESWPTPSVPAVAPLLPTLASAPSPPATPGASIVIHRVTTLAVPKPGESSAFSSAESLVADLDEYDHAIKAAIEKLWTPPKGDPTSPVRLDLHISSGGIVQIGSLKTKSTDVQLNRSATELLDKLEQIGAPLPAAMTTEYDVEVSLHAVK